MKQSPGFYAKICITCFALSAIDNCFSPSGFLCAGGCWALLCCWLAEGTSQLQLSWDTCKTGNSGQHKTNLVLDPNLPFIRPVYWLGHSAVSWWGTPRARGVRGQCHRAVSVPSHNLTLLFAHSGRSLLPQQSQSWAGYVHASRAESSTGKCWTQQRPNGWSVTMPACEILADISGHVTISLKTEQLSTSDGKLSVQDSGTNFFECLREN